MEDLKLGMPIFVTSTSGKDCLLDIVFTTLENATKRSSSSYIEVEMGKGTWGACPTRRRNNVFINTDEVKAYALNKLAERLVGASDNETTKESLFVVKYFSGHLSLMEFPLIDKVTSLRNGTFSEYVNGYSTIRIGNELPEDTFYSLNDAIECFVNKSYDFLD